MGRKMEYGGRNLSIAGEETINAHERWSYMNRI